jgi:hypothetical protein
MKTSSSKQNKSQGFYSPEELKRRLNKIFTKYGIMESQKTKQDEPTNNSEPGSYQIKFFRK